MNDAQTMTQAPPSSGVNSTKCVLCESDKVKPLYDCFDTFRIVKCANCGMVFSTLPTDKEVLEDLYSEDYYHTDTREEYYFHNRVTDETVEAEDPSLEGFSDGLSLIEKHKEKGTLLDVGCGVGVFLSLASERGWDVTGVDVSEFAASYAAEVLGHKTHSGQLEDLQLPSESFDVITLWDVIEHFPDPVQTMKEVHRLLKKDGVILVDTPNEDSILKVLSYLFYNMSLGTFSYPVKKLYHQWHLLYFTTKTLKSVLSQAGFELLSFEQRGIPITKARASPLERLIVAGVSVPEKLFSRQTELIAIAKK